MVMKNEIQLPFDYSKVREKKKNIRINDFFFNKTIKKNKEKN